MYSGLTSSLMRPDATFNTTRRNSPSKYYYGTLEVAYRLYANFPFSKGLTLERKATTEICNSRMARPLASSVVSEVPEYRVERHEVICPEESYSVESVIMIDNVEYNCGLVMKMELIISQTELAMADTYFTLKALKLLSFDLHQHEISGSSES